LHLQFQQVEGGDTPLKIQTPYDYISKEREKSEAAVGRDARISLRMLSIL
jgi:hypothetical protein